MNPFIKMYILNILDGGKKGECSVLGFPVEINRTGRPEELCSRDKGSITNSRDVSCFFCVDYAENGVVYELLCHHHHVAVGHTSGAKRFLIPALLE